MRHRVGGSKHSGRGTGILIAIQIRDKRLTETLISAAAMLNIESECCTICQELDRRHNVSGTTLISAIEWGDFNVVSSHVKAGARVDALGIRSSTSPHECMCTTPLAVAIMGKDSTIINFLLSEGAPVNNPPGPLRTSLTPLSAAVRSRDLELVDHLIERGANPYDPRALEEAIDDHRLFQALLIAMRSCSKRESKDVGGLALEKAIRKHDLDMIRAILNTPLDDFVSIDGLSLALHEAIFYDVDPNLDIVSMLLSSGADPNTTWQIILYNQKSFVASALCSAIFQKDPRKVQLLLEAGAQPDREMMNRSMLLARSKENPDIVQRPPPRWNPPCSICGAPIQIATEIRDLEIFKILLQYNANPNAIFSGMEHTPLQMVSRDGSRELVELLLEHGADVNSLPAKESGATALQFAAIKGFLGIAHLLLESGAEVNATAAEIDGRTALEVAAEHGWIDMVQLLLNAGAKIFQDGKAQYENAVRRASENGHYAVRRLLESYHG